MSCVLKQLQELIKSKYILIIYFILLSLIGIVLARTAEEKQWLSKKVYEKYLFSTENININFHTNKYSDYSFVIRPGDDPLYIVITTPHPEDNDLIPFYVPSDGQMNGQPFKLQLHFHYSSEYNINIFPSGKNSCTVNTLRIYEVSLLNKLINNFLILSPVLMLLAFAILRYSNHLSKIVIVFVLTLIAFSFLKEVKAPIFYGDTAWNMPTAYSILKNGSTNVSDYRYMMLYLPEANGYYGIYNKDEIFVNGYPPGAGIVLVPFAFWAKMLGMDEWRSATWSSIIIAASSVAIIFALFYRFTRSYSITLAATLFFAFASSHTSTHINLVWSHNVSSCISLLLLLLITSGTSWQICLSAPLIVLGYASRPDFAIIAVIFTIYIILNERNNFVAYAIAGIFSLILMLLYFKLTYLVWLPPYYTQQLAFANMSEGLMGELFSPNRGLFIYNPIALLTFIGIIVSFVKHKQNRIFVFVSFCILLFAIAISGWPCWWGGYSYGPRLYAPMFGFLAVATIPAINALRGLANSFKKFAIALLFIFFIWGGYVHLKPHLTPNNYWNDKPDPLYLSEKKLWYWHDMQIFR